MREKFFHWKLREKVLSIAIITATVPFIVTNIYWYRNAQQTIERDAANTVTIVTSQAQDQVNDFLNTKLLGLLTHSQGMALLTGEKDLIKDDLLNLLLQDPDITELSYVDNNGEEVVKVNRSKIFPESELQDVSKSDAFKIATFKFGKEFISPVSYMEGESPRITIALPVTFPENAQSFRTFSSANDTPRLAETIGGVLISTVDLTDLSQRLAALKVGKNGFVYLVDAEGKPITYPDTQIIGKANAAEPVIEEPVHPTEVARFLSRTTSSDRESISTPARTHSFKDTEVLSSHQRIDKSNWAVITEIPYSDILDDISYIQQQALLLILIPLTALIVLSILFARSLIRPIQYLVEGARNIGRGNFDYDFTQVKTGDEIEQLAHAYSDMSQKLKHEQHSLMGEKNTLKTVLESVADSVVALDSKFRVVFLNHAAINIVGIPPSEVKGKIFDEVIHYKDGVDKISILEMCRESADTGKPRKLEIKTNHNENKTVNLIISSVPPSPAVDICYLLTFYDISKEQELENMKLDFVSMAAHELRTPLTAIKGYLAYLNEDLNGKLEDKHAAYFNRVMISSNQLSAYIENLLNITKIERGVFKLDKAPFSIDKMIQNSLVNLLEVARQKKIELSYQQHETPLPDVVADQLRVEQVLVNLVSNSINYTRAGGWVKITTELNSDGIVVHVTDNGQGIPKAALPHLFTKFYRVGGSLEQGSKGTGLGLYISKSIIESHRGKIWVESIEGEGSTFSFMLPLEQK